MYLFVAEFLFDEVVGSWSDFHLILTSRLMITLGIALNFSLLPISS
jgi:hypothetical protein